MRRPRRVLLTRGQACVGLLGVRHCYVQVADSPLEHERLRAKREALFRLLDQVAFYQALVFLNSQDAARRLAVTLDRAGFPACFVSGATAQRQRMRALDSVRAFRVRVLVSTDLTARGVDLERVNLVVNLDLPRHGPTLLHRLGRTGRFGSLGLAVTVATPGEVPRLQAMLARERAGAAAELPAEVPAAWYEYSLDDGADGGDGEAAAWARLQAKEVGGRAAGARQAALAEAAAAEAEAEEEVVGDEVGEEDDGEEETGAWEEAWEEAWERWLWWDWRWRWHCQRGGGWGWVGG